jgi:hypothetical protein
MTEAEAIKVLEKEKAYMDSHGGDTQSEALAMAINALEKQIPKKILYRKQNYGTPWLCCECEADQIATEFFCEDGSEPKEKHTFCWKCGQKLDWSEV